MTPDQLIQRYAECARSVWNNFLLADRSSGDTSAIGDLYGDIRRLLFRSIVLAPLDRIEAEQPEEGEPWPFLQVTVTSDVATVLVQRPSDDGNQYWERAAEGTDLSDSELYFVDLFDWDPEGYRDLALVLAMVTLSPNAPDLRGRYVLFERGSVSVLLTDHDAGL